MDNERRHPVLKCFGIIGAFWALVLFGPVLIGFINAFTNWFSGTGFLTGSFGYKLLVFFSQSLSCVMACHAADSISNNEHGVCVLINETIATTCFLLLAARRFFAGEFWTALSDLVSVAVLIGYIVYTSKSLVNGNK